MEEGGDLLEDLLHYGVLTEVVIAAFEELLVFETVGPNRCYDLWHTNPRG